MLLTPYRRTVRALLHGIPALRKPFLRRSLRPDALLTTDLPRLTAPESLAWLIAALEAQGWTALRQGDYLELTPGLVPPAPGGQVSAGADRPALMAAMQGSHRPLRSELLPAGFRGGLQPMAALSVLSLQAYFLRQCV